MAPFPYLMWGVAFTACVAFSFSFLTALVQFLIKNTPTGTASLPMQTAPSALALIVRFTCSSLRLPTH